MTMMSMIKKMTDRQTGRQAGRQTGRQADRQTGRQDDDDVVVVDDDDQVDDRHGVDDEDDDDDDGDGDGDGDDVVVDAETKFLFLVLFSFPLQNFWKVTTTASLSNARHHVFVYALNSAINPFIENHTQFPAEGLSYHHKHDKLRYLSIVKRDYDKCWFYHDKWW